MEINEFVNVKSVGKHQDYKPGGKNVGPSGVDMVSKSTNTKFKKSHSQNTIICCDENAKMKKSVYENVTNCSENDKMIVLGGSDNFASIENSVLIIDGKTYQLIQEKDILYEDTNLINKQSTYKTKKRTEIGEVILKESAINCSSCSCLNCKYLCATCKQPCKNCNLNVTTKSWSTDTCDLDEYLDNFDVKAVIEPKYKAVSTDTCDLESHFDYYKAESNCKKIFKTKSTDCRDLINEKVIVKPSVKTIAIDTSDLNERNVFETVSTDEAGGFDEDFESSNVDVPQTELKVETDDFAPKSVKSEVVDVDMVFLHNDLETDSFIKDVFDSACKKNVDDDSESTDDSDIDLETTKQLITCKKLVKLHKLTVNKIVGDSNIYFPCYFCNSKFKKKYLAILHIQDHIVDNNFKCLSCCKVLHSRLMLKKHYNCYHDTSTNKECDKVSQDNTEPLNSHQYDLDKDSVVKKVRIKNEFVCLYCGKQFKSNKALNDHLPVHTGEKNYPCDICLKPYTTKANLHTHKLTHTGMKNFKCMVCDKAFHKKDTLKVHLRKHSGERPFQCDLCPMKFDRNYILKNHRLRHFDEKSFICPTCGKAFTTHSGLNNHEKCHKKDPNVKRARKPAVKATLDTANAVICDECGKVYSTRSNLRMHKLVHSGIKPYKCPVCNHSYAKKDSMITHMRTHTDERPFRCDVCGLTFFRNHTLKTHRLRHTGERPHKCKICGKSFTQSSSLAYHAKHHERMEKNKMYSVDENMKLPRKKRFSSALKQHSATYKKPQRSYKYNISKPKYCVLDKSKDDVIEEDKEEMLLKGDRYVVKDASPKQRNDEEGEIIQVENVAGNGYEVYDMSKHHTTMFDTLNIVQPNKVNCFVTKHGNILTVTKQTKKETKPNESEQIYHKDIPGENLIISKNSYITKDGNLVIASKLSTHDKDEYLVVDDVKNNEDLTLQMQTNEILNATVISEQDVLPFNSVTLHNVPENVLLNPVFISGYNKNKINQKHKLNDKKNDEINKNKFKNYSQGMNKNLGITFINNKADSSTTPCSNIITNDVISNSNNIITGSILDPAKLDLQSVASVQFCIV